ncbi:MAG: metalloprotease TldD [Gammaproteobacteria bacterium]|nr:MAG: metalloprotease TldD [Gammaproteobacteria bacterium]
MLPLAEQYFLAPNQLSWGALEKSLNEMLATGADAADLYFQKLTTQHWSLENGIVKSGHFLRDQGVGLRIQQGEKTGLAYTQDLTLPAIQQASQAANAIIKHGQSKICRIGGAMHTDPRYPSVDPMAGVKAEDIVGLLAYIDQEAKRQHPAVCQVMASFSVKDEQILVLASDGTVAFDHRPLCRLNVSVVAARGERREHGSAGGGGRQAVSELFLTDGRPSPLVQYYIEEAVRQALVNLDAVPAPAGVMPVVLGPGWPGVLLHEAVGHGLEGDFNRRGSSAFTGRIGEMVASPLCTIVDDATLPNRRGSLTVDDEGTPGQQTLLIEKGRLVGYMFDKHNARLMGTASTGNGRRESYAHLTIPRMTNTYMLAGEDDPEDIIRSVKKGIYATNFGGGQVDITSGQFVFSANEAYLIEDGQITAPIKGATLIGHGPEVLKKVSRVGHDLELDSGVGVCGKDGQSVPVGVGQPTIKVDELLVGGTEV